ncbi:hypothetical protein [Nesterenkonia ebinurensis]|uniref:hypothetical protein n=1 Tax=Nesterenkonia ebinurensis TaxID=2608252 RepID=UPI00123DA94A|nr:hypothetical protein [Nesterenkonia ebinurensis]
MEVAAKVGLSEVSTSTWEKTPLRPHYADEFVLQLNTPVKERPEDWARAIFGDRPDMGQWFIFQALLHYPLQMQPSPHTVVGWPIAQQTENWIRLENRSASTTCHLLISRDDDKVSLTTLMRYHRRFGKWTWEPLSFIHRRLAPDLLRNAARALDPAITQHTP